MVGLDVDVCRCSNGRNTHSCLTQRQSGVLKQDLIQPKCSFANFLLVEVLTPNTLLLCPQPRKIYDMC